MIQRRIAVEPRFTHATWDPTSPKQTRQHFTPPFKDIDYLERFYILSTPWIGLYLHRFWSDDDDGLHDHPWASASVLLQGGYLEEMPERQSVPHGPTIIKLRRPRHPWIKFRSATDAHRITIPADNREETWSLFIRFSFKRRIWGFYRDGGWQKAPVQSREESGQ